MAQSVATLLLISGLVLCPFRCQVKPSFCADEETAEPAPVRQCCSRCRSAAPQPVPNPQAPTDQHESPAGDPCQCICSGAVVEKSGYDGLCELISAVADFDLLPPAVSLSAGPPDGGSDPPPPDPGSAAGRALRMLHQSLLC